MSLALNNPELQPVKHSAGGKPLPLPLSIMNITIHRASSRGHANHGWLDTYHTFSFANYFNPERMQFGALRVLNDDELAGVLGHELTHIRNRDTRVLITSIVFVGIVSTVMSVVMHMMFNAMFYGSHSRSRDEKGSGVSIIIVMLVGVVCCAVAYFFTLITRFAISRKREYMADAGGAELCGNPLALASALRKISGAPGLQGVQRQDVAQLFIIHPQALTSGMMGFFDSLFSTHPDTRKRIAILEQF